MKRFIFHDHQRKGTAYRQALISDGWMEVDRAADAEIAFLDSDVTGPRCDNIQRLVDRGIKVFIYPHAARPPIFYDFEGYPENPNTTAQFVTTPVHIEVLRRIGYKGPLHAVGWSLCPLREFRRTEQIGRILFAPIHANLNGWLSQPDLDINREAFERVLQLSHRWNTELVVRYIDNLERIGLYKLDGVRYVHGRPDQNFADIDAADLVVATQTMLYLAVARGKPALGMGEWLPQKMGYEPSALTWSRSWDRYKDLMAYPLDILDSAPAHYTAISALVRNQAVDEWRTNMIGSPFQSAIFLHDLYTHL